MPVSVVCPSCSKKLKAPDHLIGHKTRCPQCNAVVLVADPAAPAPKPKAATPKASPPPRPAAPLVPELASAPPALPDTLGRRHDAVPAQRPSGFAHSLGVAALVVGVLAVLVCWIPVVGIAVAGLGLMLGIGGLAVSIARRGSGLGFPIAGSALSGIALVVCVVWTVILGGAVNAMDRALRETAGKNAVPPKPGAAADAGRPKGDAPVPAAKDAEPEWADAGKGAIREGGIQVRVERVSVAKVPLKAMFGGKDGSSKEPLLMVALELVNADPTKKATYSSWRGRDFPLERDYGTLVDNFGNAYKRINFGIGSPPVGAVEGSASLYPQKAVSDVLVFEVPLDTAEYLRLELPAKNVGGTGMLRLQIPKTMIRRG